MTTLLDATLTTEQRRQLVGCVSSPAWAQRLTFLPARNVHPGSLATSPPTPHSPVFDFEATSAGAEWIDALATEAAAVIAAAPAPEVVVHADWRADNI